MPQPRGLFLNTIKAQCSIYESGRMAFECLRQSDRYVLDYLEIDAQTSQFGIYDFYLFNYHHMTMSWLDTRSLRKLPGKKFTLVLETLPNNPFPLCPPHDFDAYLALDPTMNYPDKRVYAFPRPLEIPPQLPPYVDRGVPVIGSFGFATPGKGFELVVDAVGREFKKAVVRINIPSSTYADNFYFTLHRMNYARYLAELCRRVARPEIDVQVTYDFLPKDELITWCSQNTLNCFLYHRDQPGLAATTDQAITSGRPLAVSANETFRHIHIYTRPYPFQSLRDSITTSAPAVQQMQQEWAPLRCAEHLEAVLEDFELLPSRPHNLIVNRAPSAMSPKPVVIVVSHKEIQCGIHQYGVNIVVALSKSERYTFEHVLCSSADELHQHVTRLQSAAIIYNYYPLTMPWLSPEITRRYQIPCLGVMHEVTQEDADNATTEMFDYHLCPDPTLEVRNPCIIKTKRLIAPYINTLPEPKIPVIGSFGFGFGNKGFQEVVTKVQQEFDQAIIRLHLPLNDMVDPTGATGAEHAFKTAEECRRVLHKPGIELRIRHNFLEKKELLNFLATNTINCFFYETNRVKGISSVIEHALAVQRPMAISKCGMFRHVLNVAPSICIEDASLRQIISNGIAPLVPFYNEWSEASFIMDYEQIMDRVLEMEEDQKLEP